MTTRTKRNQATGKYYGIAICDSCRFEITAEADTCPKVLESLDFLTRLDAYKDD
jgi:hypothetical protein